MKNTRRSFSFIFFGFVFFFFSSQVANSQNISNPPFPAIAIQLLDSTSIFQTKNIGKSKPVVFLLFNTTCEHCQKETRDLVKYKEELNKVNLIMISSEEITRIRSFYQQYSLSQIKGLVIGRDSLFAGTRLFMNESFPFCAVYSKKHLFLKSFERNFTTDSIFKVLKSNGEL